MREGGFGTCASIIAAGVILFSLAASATAHAGIMEEEAERQLQFAEADLEAGNFERAAASAASALRADPSRHEALVVRGLALQGLNRLEDALALLRVYKDLRGTLEVDERVEPAMAEIERLLAGPDLLPVLEKPMTSGPIEGLAAVMYGSDSDERAAEHAYAAAQPFLDGQPAAAVLALGSLLPRGDELVVVGPEPLLCDDTVLEGTLEGHLAAAEAAAVELEPATADEAAEAAELHLACGSAAVEPETVGRLLAVQAQARWFAGEPERASSLWREMFAVSPERTINTDLPPSAQALQLDAKTRASEERTVVDLQAIIPKGWSLRVDGVEVAGEVQLTPGRRILRLVGPKGALPGFVLPLEHGRHVLVGTADAFQDRLYRAQPPGLLLSWLGSKLAPAMEQESVRAAVVVNLDVNPPNVRLFDGTHFLVVTPDPQLLAPSPASGAALTARRRGASVVTGVLAGALVAGGATALGLSQHAANRRVRPRLVCHALGDSGDSCAEEAKVKTQQDGLLASGVVMLGLGAVGATLSVTFGAPSRGRVNEPGWARSPAVPEDDVPGGAR